MLALSRNLLYYSLLWKQEIRSARIYLCAQMNFRACLVVYNVAILEANSRKAAHVPELWDFIVGLGGCVGDNLLQGVFWRKIAPQVLTGLNVMPQQLRQNRISSQDMHLLLRQKSSCTQSNSQWAIDLTVVAPPYLSCPRQHFATAHPSKLPSRQETLPSQKPCTQVFVHSMEKFRFVWGGFMLPKHQLIDKSWKGWKWKRKSQSQNWFNSRSRRPWPALAGGRSHSSARQSNRSCEWRPRRDDSKWTKNDKQTNKHTNKQETKETLTTAGPRCICYHPSYDSAK